jgi:hypothetical protein
MAVDHRARIFHPEGMVDSCLGCGIIVENSFWMSACSPQVLVIIVAKKFILDF